MEIFSKIIKEVRQGKGLKQKEITENVMSRTTYSKIERGLITPGIFNFYNILSKLNVGFDEFFYLYSNNDFDDRWRINNAFRNTRANFEVDELKIIKNMCNDFLIQQQDNHINNIRNVCNALLEIHNNNLYSAQKIAKAVWNDLSKRDTWYYDDILLINNILFLFEEEVIENMYNRALLNSNKYNEFQNNLNNNIQFSLKFNKLSYDMFYGNIKEEHHTLIEILIEESHNLRYYDMKAVLLIRKGLIQDNNALIEKGLNILDVLELDELANSVREEMKLYSCQKS